MAHASSPSADLLSGPAAHAGSPSVTFDPKPHAGAPVAQTLSGPAAHAGSPSVTFEPKPHAGAPVAQTLSGPAAHAGSPSVTFEPKPHAGAPVAEMLSGPAAHAGSPSVTFEPTPHAGAPIATGLSEPVLSGVEGPVEDGPTEEGADRSDGRSSTSSDRPEQTLSPARGEGAMTTPSVTSALRGLFDAARTSIGFASRGTEVDHWGKDTTLAASLRPLGELLYEKYWRVKVEGAEHLPNGPFIIVANHAGALPLDGPVLHLAIKRERPELLESRWLLEDQIFHAPFVGVLANRLGAVRANPESALRLLEESRPLIVFPEGFHGLSKPFTERYQLKRFGRGGYVKIALKAGVPIVPAAIVGGEESMPLLGKLPGGLFGVEYLPVTLPPLPARWHIRFAPPIDLDGAPREPEHDLAWVERKNFAVRDQIAAMLEDLLKHRDGIF
jgi:1-acyl-sn-glycerol-3-phosphate acyltransferase